MSNKANDKPEAPPAVRCSAWLGHRICKRDNLIKCLLYALYACVSASFGVVECNGGVNQVSESLPKISAQQKCLALNLNPHLSVTRAERQRLSAILLIADFGAQACHKITKGYSALLLGGSALLSEGEPAAELRGQKPEKKAQYDFKSVIHEFTPLLTMAAFVAGLACHEWYQTWREIRHDKRRWSNDSAQRPSD